MRQREVTGPDGTTWTCTQAFTGPGGDDEEERLDENGHVRVVCTPSGGAASVSLQLEPDWVETASDDHLVAAIERGRAA